MSDVFDRAQELELAQREAALAAHAAASKSQGESLTHCIDCGGEIPLERRLAAIGCTRCARCQSRHEKEHP